MLNLLVSPALERLGDDTVLRYDLFRFAACLEGLLNRARPVLFLEWEAHDRFWLDWCRAPGNFLEDEPIETIDSFDALLVRFAEEIRACGLILWDPAVPATLHAATTVCGCEGLLPVRAGSRALDVIRARTGAEVRLDLTGRFDGRGTVWQTD